MPVILPQRRMAPGGRVLPHERLHPAPGRANTPEESQNRASCSGCGYVLPAARCTEPQLCRSVVYGVSVIEVRLEHMLVDRVALLGIQLTRKLFRQPIQRFFNGHTHGGAGPLLLAPVDHEL